jgi:hypothetical protein
MKPMIRRRTAFPGRRQGTGPTNRRPFGASAQEACRKSSRKRAIVRRRRGFTLLEIGTAAALLAIMLVVCARLFRAVANQRRAIEDRRAAIAEIDNVMERLCARPWDELSAQSAGEASLSEEVQQVLPGGRLEIDVSQPGDEPNAKRITVILYWPGGSDQPERSVRVVAWRYRKSEE